MLGSQQHRKTQSRYLIVEAKYYEKFINVKPAAASTSWITEKLKLGLASFDKALKQVRRRNSDDDD